MIPQGSPEMIDSVSSFTSLQSPSLQLPFSKDDGLSCSQEQLQMPVKKEYGRSLSQGQSPTTRPSGSGVRSCNRKFSHCESVPVKREYNRRASLSEGRSSDALESISKSSLHADSLIFEGIDEGIDVKGRKRRPSISNQFRGKNKQFDEFIDEKISALYYHPYLKPVFEKLKPVLKFWKEKQIDEFIGRLFILTFFLGEMYKWSFYWRRNRINLPFTVYLLPLCMFFVLLNIKKEYFCLGLLLEVSYDLKNLIVNQFYLYYYNKHPIVNELMVKKLAVFGSTFLMTLQAFKASGHSPTFLRNLDPTKPKTHNKKQSFILLFCRLLMCSLFVFIGYQEIKRQINTAGHFYSNAGRRVARRPVGDGHDQLMFKLLEFLLCIVVVLGYRTATSSYLLALVIFSEAFIQWSFWNSLLSSAYIRHAVEHFVVNIAVSGGLILLASFGGGQYSVDAWMKKLD